MTGYTEEQTEWAYEYDASYLEEINKTRENFEKDRWAWSRTEDSASLEASKDCSTGRIRSRTITTSYQNFGNRATRTEIVGTEWVIKQQNLYKQEKNSRL